MGRARQARPELTPRQREVLGLVAQGHSNSQIAEMLGITVDGAKWHVSELLARVGVDSREELAAVSRIEPLTGMFVSSFRHVVVFDAEDGTLYGDIVWAVAADGSETLWEARAYTHPTVVPEDRSPFSGRAAPIC